MTPEQMVYLVLAIAGAVGGAYWRFSSLVASVKDELSQHKLHCSEVFATKAGIESQTMQIMKAIEGVAARIDSLNDRLDRLYEAKPTRRT